MKIVNGMGPSVFLLPLVLPNNIELRKGWFDFLPSSKEIPSVRLRVVVTDRGSGEEATAPLRPSARRRVGLGEIRSTMFSWVDLSSAARLARECCGNSDGIWTEWRRSGSVRNFRRGAASMADRWQPCSSPSVMWTFAVAVGSSAASAHVESGRAVVDSEEESHRLLG